MARQRHSTPSHEAGALWGSAALPVVSCTPELKVPRQSTHTGQMLPKTKLVNHPQWTRPRGAWGSSATTLWSAVPSPDLQTCTPKHGEPLAPGFRHAYSTAPGHAASQAQGVQKKAHHLEPEPGMGTPTGTTAEGTETQLRRLRADHQNPGVTVPCSKTDTDGPGHRLLASSLRQSTVLHGRRTRQGTCP